MAAVLVDSAAEWMSLEELASRIADLDLYRRPKDGEHAEAFQLRLRARQYPQYFEGDDSKFSRVRMRLDNHPPARPRVGSAGPMSRAHEDNDAKAGDRITATYGT